MPIETRRSGFSLLGATAAFFVLTCMAHAVSGPSSNINYAFYIPDTLSGTSATVLNNIDRRWYLLALNACACACCFLPAWGLLRVVDRMIASNLGSDRAEGQTLGRA